MPSTLFVLLATKAVRRSGNKANVLIYLQISLVCILIITALNCMISMHIFVVYILALRPLPLMIERVIGPQWGGRAELLLEAAGLDTRVPLFCLALTIRSQITIPTSIFPTTHNYWSTFHNYSHIQHHQSMQLHGHTPHHIFKRTNPPLQQALAP